MRRRCWPVVDLETFITKFNKASCNIEYWKIVQQNYRNTRNLWKFVKFRNFVRDKVTICDIEISWYHIFLYLKEIFPCGDIRCIHFISPTTEVAFLSLADVMYWLTSSCWLHNASNSIVIDTVRAWLVQNAGRRLQDVGRRMVKKIFRIWEKKHHQSSLLLRSM